MAHPYGLEAQSKAVRNAIKKQALRSNKVFNATEAASGLS
jgi:hypothetical protein